MTEREKFEAWFETTLEYQLKGDKSLSVNHNDYYNFPEARHAWSAWQARAAQDEWISVEDRLPKKEGMYLTYWSDGSLETFYFNDMKTSDEPWHFVLLENAVITHWKPLPEGPKE